MSWALILDAGGQAGHGHLMRGFTIAEDCRLWAGILLRQHRVSPRTVCASAWIPIEANEWTERGERTDFRSFSFK